jgi:arylsulfatase A-like enzyme
VDGKDMLPWLTGDETVDEDGEDLFFEFGYVRAIATRKWKYIALRYPRRLVEEMKTGQTDAAYSYIGRVGQSLAIRRYPNYFDPDQLYDLENDPEEQRNLANDPAHAGVLGEMKERLRGYLRTFERAFKLDNFDEFLLSDRFRKMCEKTAAMDMNRFDWYRKGWY